MPAVQGTLRYIWKAIRQLDPSNPIQDARRSFTLAIVGSREDEVASIRAFLLGPKPSSKDVESARVPVRAYVTPLDDSKPAEICACDLVLATESATEIGDLRGRQFTFDPAHPESSVKAILSTRRGEKLRLALAASFPAFRAEVTRRIVREVSRENALFVIATALGDVVPSVFQPLIGFAEAATDTVFLTANQVRMLFLLGAAHGRMVGYSAQWREIISIVGAAFGWRSIARNLVGKIPFGGGLVPKGAVAYAGTTVVGEGLIFFYTTGRRMTRKEMKEAFKRAYSDALGAVKSLVGKGKSESVGSGSPSD
ncbi:MAG: hypothetical protein NTU88_01925 [Armatimonadetes bacterium]|nr:hypothetical protein [Armatimonadota bacterium]